MKIILQTDGDQLLIFKDLEHMTNEIKGRVICELELIKLAILNKYSVEGDKE